MSEISLILLTLAYKVWFLWLISSLSISGTIWMQLMHLRKCFRCNSGVILLPHSFDCCLGLCLSPSGEEIGSKWFPKVIIYINLFFFSIYSLTFPSPQWWKKTQQTIQMEESDDSERPFRNRFWNRAGLLVHVRRATDLVSINLFTQRLCYYHSRGRRASVRS